MALAGSYSPPVFSMFPSKDHFIEENANVAQSIGTAIEEASDTTESLSDQEEYLAEYFLRECESKVEEFSPRPSTIQESPDFFKFLPQGSDRSLSLRLKQTKAENETKKIKLDEVQAARRAHRTLRKKRLTFEDLKLSSKRLKKDKEITVMGKLFQKVLSWSSDSPSCHKTLPKLDVANESSVDNKHGEVETRAEEGIVQLGLTRHSVTKLQYYNKEMRRKAQSRLFGGKKNISFLDKVEVVEIPLLREMSSRIKQRMFYSRNDFYQMIARNLKEIEKEARRRQRRRRKRELLRR